MNLSIDSMKSIIGIIYILLLILILSCRDSPFTADNRDKGNVNFMVSSDHFVKNFYSGETNPSYLLICSYSSFDSLFGVGVTWDTDYSKLITEEKMDDGFVLSIIYQGNDIHDFDMDKITLKDNQIKVYYTSEVTTPDASWECNCHITTLIENCEFNSILLFENGDFLSNALIRVL